MTTIQVRKNLHGYIEHIDERFLNAMYAMVEEYLKSSHINFVSDTEEDYTKLGKPMSVETFRKKILAASKSAKLGETIRQEDLEKEAEEW